MDDDLPPGADHLQRAARDARIPDADFECRVARKNAVVAGALREERIALADAQHLLYDAELRDTIADHRPRCLASQAILAEGCALASLEQRLLKWSPELPALVDQHLAILLLRSQSVLAPDALLSALRSRPTLKAAELDLAAAIAAADPAGTAVLLPVLVRTITADLSAWPPEERDRLLARALAMLERFRGAGEGEALAASASCRDLALETEVMRWRRWWEAEGPRRYPDPRDALPRHPHAPRVPIALLPEGGGDYTLDPPMPLVYEGRDTGERAVFTLRPRARPRAGTWLARIETMAALLLTEGEAAAPEYEGICALHGESTHPTRPGEALLLAIPDPDAPIAWLSCTECGHAGYVRYARTRHDLADGRALSPLLIS